jgi:hypothetical protein
VKKMIFALLFVAACGDNLPGPITYDDPPAGGKLRLVRDSHSNGAEVVLDLVVGDQPLTGYSVGFDLPMVEGAVQLMNFSPGTALPAGNAPAAAAAAIPTDGPLANMLVTAQSQKASGDGAVTTDATLAPGTVLYQLRLAPAANAQPGVVFDGTAKDFVLPSGGMRDRAGDTVVMPSEVAIGRLTLN